VICTSHSTTVTCSRRSILGSHLSPCSHECASLVVNPVRALNPSKMLLTSGPIPYSLTITIEHTHSCIRVTRADYLHFATILLKSLINCSTSFSLQKVEPCKWYLSIGGSGLPMTSSAATGASFSGSGQSTSLSLSLTMLLYFSARSIDLK